MKLKPGSGDAPEIGFLGEHSDPACKNPVTCPEGLEGRRIQNSGIQHSNSSQISGFAGQCTFARS